MAMVTVPVEMPVTKYLHDKATRTKTPLTGTFELTPVCNMDCKMCYVRMSREQQEAIHPLYSAQDWLELGRQAQKMGMLYLLLTGGEPFLRKDFREIMQGLHRMGLIISINSNGTMIDEETVAWLKETPPVRINITLYGTSDETYARLCGNPKGFTQVTKAIRLLREAGIIVKLNCSLTPYNRDDLPGIIQFARDNGLVVQCSSYMFPPMRRDSEQIGKNNRFTPEEAAYEAARVEQLLNGDEAYLARVKAQESTPLPGDSSEYCLDTSEEGDGILCRAGKCSFWVTWDGRVLPCGMLPLPDVANAFESGFEAAWKRATQIVSTIRLPVKCKNCPEKEQCKACAAMVLTESGDFTTVPEYRCQMTMAYEQQRRRLAREIIAKRGSGNDE